MARSSDSGKAAAWRRRVGRFEHSGLTVASFCEQEGVSTASFYRWRNRLADQRGAVVAEQVAVVEKRVKSTVIRRRSASSAAKVAKKQAEVDEAATKAKSAEVAESEKPEKTAKKAEPKKAAAKKTETAKAAAPKKEDAKKMSSDI